MPASRSVAAVVRWWLVVLPLVAPAWAHAAAPDLPTDPAFWQRLETLPPTPRGDGYLPGVPPGQFVQFRYAVPPRKPPAYWVNLDNVVALTGRGSSYQVEVRVDSPTGPRLYQGPRTSDPYAFNAEDLSRLDATAFLREEHARQGFIDLYVTATVAGDTWTTYRDHDGTPRDLYARVPDPTRLAAWQQLQAEREALAARGVLLLPHPKRIELRPADFALAAGVAVGAAGVADPDLLRTARQLAAEIGQRTGLGVPVSAAVGTRQVRLSLIPGTGAEVPAEIGSQGYVVDVRADGAEVQARTPLGVFYGVQTLGQLIGLRDGRPVIHGVRVVDWPDLPNRMVQYDIARGNTVNVAYWKRWIRELSRLKINQIMLYLELAGDGPRRLRRPVRRGVARDPRPAGLRQRYRPGVLVRLAGRGKGAVLAASLRGFEAALRGPGGALRGV